MASWNHLPFEMKSLILEHYMRTLLHDTSYVALQNLPPILKPSRRVMKELPGLICTASEARTDLISLAKGMEEELIILLESTMMP